MCVCAYAKEGNRNREMETKRQFQEFSNDLNLWFVIAVVRWQNAMKRASKVNDSNDLDSLVGHSMHVNFMRQFQWGFLCTKFLFTWKCWDFIKRNYCIFDVTRVDVFDLKKCSQNSFKRNLDLLSNTNKFTKLVFQSKFKLKRSAGKGNRTHSDSIGSIVVFLRAFHMCLIPFFDFLTKLFLNAFRWIFKNYPNKCMQSITFNIDFSLKSLTKFQSNKKITYDILMLTFIELIPSPYSMDKTRKVMNKWREHRFSDRSKQLSQVEP